MVVVDRISKYAHFVLYPTHLSPIWWLTPTLVAQAFVDQIFKLQGMPMSIMSDCGLTFTSKFGQDIFKIQGTQFQIITSYHPQTDGQTEAVNKCLETYLWCFTSKGNING